MRVPTYPFVERSWRSCGSASGAVSSDPDQPTPSLDGIIICSEISGRIALHLQSTHHRLRSDVVRGCIGENLLFFQAVEGVPQRGLRGLRRIPATPCVSHQPPTDFAMRSKWMVDARRHDAGVAKKSTVPGFDRPATETVSTVDRCVAVHFCVALIPAERPSVVTHDFHIGVHGSERVSIGLLPASKQQAWRLDDHTFLQAFPRRFVERRRGDGVKTARPRLSCRTSRYSFACKISK